MLQPDEHFLKRRRQELGLSQGDLSLRLSNRGVHLSRKMISCWERGKAPTQLERQTLEALADALHWDLDELMKAI